MNNFHRNHFITIIDKTFSSFFKSFLPLVIIIFSKDTRTLSFSSKLLIMLGIFLIIALYQIIKWFNDFYCIQDNLIMIKKGLLFVKQKEIPFNKIQTVDISQGIKHRIFGLALVKVDTGNSSIKKEELSFVLKKAEAENFKNDIFSVKNNNSAELCNEEVKIIDKENNSTSTPLSSSKEFKVSTKELTLSALTSNGIFAGIVFLFSAYAILDDYIKDFLENTLKKASNTVKSINFQSMSLTYLVLWIILLIIIYITFSFIISIISTIIKYHGFSVKRENDNLIISYGLLEKKNYIMPIKKISAVYLKQNVIKQLLGFRALHIETVGYGNEKGESSILYPLTVGSRHNNLMEELLPEFSFNEAMIKVPTRALGRFIKLKFIFTLAISIILTLNFKYGYICFLSVPFFLLIGYLQYRNSAIGKGSNLLCISNKSFTKVISIIPVNKLQSVKTENNYFQKRKDLFNLEVSIQGNHFGTAIKIKNLSSELRNELELLI